MGDAKITKFKIESAGMLALLNEGFVRAELTKRAERVRNAASAGDPSFTYEVEQATTDRAAVRVGSRDDGVLFAESETGNLARALDAGAGSS